MPQSCSNCVITSNSHRYCLLYRDIVVCADKCLYREVGENLVEKELLNRGYQPFCKYIDIKVADDEIIVLCDRYNLINPNCTAKCGEEIPKETTLKELSEEFIRERERKPFYFLM